MDNIPKGVVAVLVTKEGREIVNATDFDCGSPAGFTQFEAQKLRVREALAMKVVRELSAPLLGEAVDKHDAWKILRKMCDNGCRMIVIPIGYDDQEIAEK